MTNETRAWVEEVVNTLYNAGFWSVLDDEESVEDWSRSSGLTYNYQFAYGETKIAVFDKHNHDWVIKFNYSTVPMDCIRRTHDDYCYREAENYAAACALELGCCFAATYFVDEFYGIDVYIQEQVEADETMIEDELKSVVITGKSESELREIEEKEHISRDEVRFSDSIADEVWGLTDEDRIWALFDNTTANELNDFCQAHHINDLHCGNWGRRRDTSDIVILDFSGYNW